MKAPSPPPTPDPYKTAAAQQMANVEVAVANTALQNADEYRPDGSVVFEEIPELIPTNTYGADGNITGTRNIKRWKKTVSLTPEGQTQFSQQQQISIKFNDVALQQANLMQSNLQQPISLGSLTPRQSVPATPTIIDGVVTPGALTETIGSTDLVAHLEATRDAIDFRLQYQIEIDREARITRLANMGIFPGSEAYNRDMLTFDKQSTDARLQAYLAARQEQTRIIQLEQVVGDFRNKTQEQKFNQSLLVIEIANKVTVQRFQVALEAANYVNTLRQGELQEQIAWRAQTVNEISSMMNGGQINVPQFQGFRAGHISDTPVGQYVYQSAAMDMQKWQTKVQSQQSMFGGMMGLFGNLMSMPMMMSSPELKTDIGSADHIIELLAKLNIATWRYSDDAQRLLDLDGDRHIGPMADQWAELFGGDGIRIDTVKATEVVLATSRAMGISPIDVFGTALAILKAQHKSRSN